MDGKSKRGGVSLLKKKYRSPHKKKVDEGVKQLQRVVSIVNCTVMYFLMLFFFVILRGKKSISTYAFDKLIA